MLSIVCWKWKADPDSPTTKKKQVYTSAHVNALYFMLKKNVTLPFELICVTDDPVGINSGIKIIPLWDEFKSLGGCFVRLVCFKKNFKLFGDRFFSIDLDCVITGNIDHILKREEPFLIWSPDENALSRRSVDYCGSFFGLTVGSHSEVYDEFEPKLCIVNKHGRYSGGSDQRQISKVIDGAVTVGQKEGIYNFMPDLSPMKNNLPEDCSLVFFNGYYLPDDPGLKTDFLWIAKNYPLAGKGMERYNAGTVARKRERVKTILNRHKEPVKFITFVMFWWGNWPADNEKLARKYIDRLSAGIKKHVPEGIAYQIILFTDRPKMKFKGINVRLLDVPDGLRWNLKKMFMYSRRARLKGPVICLDLDCIIVGNLTPLINAVLLMGKKKLATCAGAYHKRRIGGSIIGFHPSLKLQKILWNPIVKDQKGVEAKTKGSERKHYQLSMRVAHVLLWEKALPGAVLSYKRDCKEGLSELGMIVRFHGRPRPHEVTDNWVKEHWK